LRAGRVSLASQVYLVTFTTYHRRRHFADFDRGCRMARAMCGFSRNSTTRVLAWVLMPDHWHGLVEVGAGDDLSDWVGRLKGASAFGLRRAEPGVGRIWADGFHDHALREDEALVDCARYIVLNPVRAGLVVRVGDYPFWDAVWLDGWEPGGRHRG
jgi:REP element-mobilizing transposase RayT